MVTSYHAIDHYGRPAYMQRRSAASFGILTLGKDPIIAVFALVFYRFRVAYERLIRLWLVEPTG